jgi:hypothetical protein
MIDDPRDLLCLVPGDQLGPPDWAPRGDLHAPSVLLGRDSPNSQQVFRTIS